MSSSPSRWWGSYVRLTERVFGGPAGVVAEIIAALHPLLIALSVSTYSESLYLSLATGACLLAIECMPGASWRRAVTLGAAIAAAYLTRPGSVLMPLFAGLVFVPPGAGVCCGSAWCRLPCSSSRPF